MPCKAVGIAACTQNAVQLGASVLILTVLLAPYAFILTHVELDRRVTGSPSTNRQIPSLSMVRMPRRLVRHVNARPTLSPCNGPEFAVSTKS